jgi:hypothetical protein
MSKPVDVKKKRKKPTYSKKQVAEFRDRLTNHRCIRCGEPLTTPHEVKAMWCDSCPASETGKQVAP